MKYAIVIPDGCADEPLASLGGLTPLQKARLPNMDQIARQGIVGQSNNVPEGFTPGSDVATLSLLGYDPNVYFTGRAPLEAAAQGIELGPEDWAIRCNLVTVRDQVMESFTAGQISNEEARRLLETAQASAEAGLMTFVPGVSYRNLLLYRPARGVAPFTADTRTTPPHDLTDKCVLDDYPKGPGSEELTHWMTQSVEWFADHPVNVARRAAGKLPATNVWLWGLGKRPALTVFFDRFKVTGTMITAVDLLRGIAALLGWRRMEVPGATGYLDTDYAAKGRYAVAALAETDLVCVHVEATDEASHEGDAEAKIAALESIDRHIVGPLLDALPRYGDYRILVSPDHPTPVRTKTHSYGLVPFAMAGTGIVADLAQTYDEVAAANTGLVMNEGWRLMEKWIG
jgi:2,3-bisphosphoglycerate-independent phosphoglycerate mutase